MAPRLQRLLQRFGFEFREGPKTQLFTPQALNQFWNMMFAVPDPDAVLTKAGVTRAALRDLTGDDDITAALDTRREALLGVAYHFEVEEDAGTSKEALTWLEGQFDRVCEIILRASMESLPYGYSVIEAVYAYDGATNRITWGEVSEKPFEWFIPKLDGSVLYKSRENPQGEETDPRKFFLTVRNPTYRNPYGEAMFARLYWPWFFRTNGWKFWAKWLERFGTPMLLGTTAGDAETMATRLAYAVQNAVVAVGQGDSVSILEQKSGSAQFESFERAIIERYQRTILGQTLTSGSDGKGSYALGQVHNEVRMDRRDADVRAVQRTVQRMIDVLWRLNSFAGAAPEFKMLDDTGIEEERATRDAALANAGVCSFTEDYLIRVYDFEPGDIVVTGGANGGAGGTEQPGQPPKGKPTSDPRANPIDKKTSATALFASQYTPQQQVIEDRIAPVLAAARSPIDPALIREAILAADNEDDLVRRLAALMQGKSIQEFEATLGHALYVADIIGFAHATTKAKQPSE